MLFLKGSFWWLTEKGRTLNSLEKEIDSVLTTHQEALFGRLHNIEQELGDSSRNTLRLQRIQQAIREEYDFACNESAERFSIIKPSSSLSSTELETLFKAKVGKWWLEIEQSDVITKFKTAWSAMNMEPSWGAIQNLFDRLQEETKQKHIIAYHATDTPTLAQLKNSTPENWKSLFGRGNEDDLHSIAEDRLICDNNIVIDRAKRELRERERQREEASVSRSEKHDKDLVLIRVFWTGIVTLIIALILYFLDLK